MIKYILGLLLMLSLNLPAKSFMHEALVGEWRSKENNSVLIFNKDHTCKLYLEEMDFYSDGSPRVYKKTFEGTWVIDKTYAWVSVVDKNFETDMFGLNIFEGSDEKKGMWWYGWVNIYDNSRKSIEFRPKENK